MRAPDGQDDDVSISGHGSSTYLSVGAINASGVITRAYDTTNPSNAIVFHGFLRAPDGGLTSFDAPGAGIGGSGEQGTLPADINPTGTITGFYGDASAAFHGFVRAPDGSFTTFDAPGAAPGFQRGTVPTSINQSGVIAGYYADGENVPHGFLRAWDGGFTTFDAPGANLRPGKGTRAQSINRSGATAGYYVDLAGVHHGFLRAPNGSFIAFSAPGAGTHRSPRIHPGTFPVAINTRGEIAGTFTDDADGSHGFVRFVDGKFARYDVPGAAYRKGTFITGYNSLGTLTEFVNKRIGRKFTPLCGPAAPRNRRTRYHISLSRHRDRPLRVGIRQRRSANRILPGAGESGCVGRRRRCNRPAPGGASAAA